MLRKIAPDKWKHFLVGIGMGLVLQPAACWLMAAHLYTATAMVLLLIIAVSYGFELFSKFSGIGHYEVMDAVASVIGGLMGMGIVIFLFWISSR